MQGEDSDTFQINKSPSLSTRSAEAALITLERSQKLDLLIHLIANLSQSLVICGPKGIGKTTLLDELKLRKQNVWSIFTMQASDGLSFEALQSQVQRLLRQAYPEYKNYSLAEILSAVEKQSQKIVILIDDAGQLVPGLISNIIQYAAANECLRLVFSLTQDEVHLKNSSDSEIDDCHFIEIPPLNEKQCGVFLQNLSAQPNAAISFNAINERLVERVYKKTHGIPGGIITELPKMAHYKVSKSNGRLVGIFFMAIVVVAFVNIFVLNGDNSESIGQGSETLVLQKSEKINITPPIVNVVAANAFTKDEALPRLKEITVIDAVVEIKKELPLSTPLQDNGGEVNDLLIKKEVLLEAIGDTKKEIEVKALLNEKKTAVVKEKKTEVAENIKLKKEVDDRVWVLKQPENNYTIQLMVLSSRKSVDMFLKANPRLKDHIKFLEINKQNQKYALIYGSFKSTASATNKMKSLPAKYKKSWIRKVSNVQKGLKNKE